MGRAIVHGGRGRTAQQARQAEQMPGIGLGAQLVDQIALAERCEQKGNHQDRFTGLRIGALVILAQGIEHRRRFRVPSYPSENHAANPCAAPDPAATVALA